MSTPNPYAAPKAPVVDASGGPRNFVPTGRPVAAGRGWSWIVEGFELFKRQPGAWIAIIIVAALVFVGLALIPFLGSLAGMVLAPVFAGGLVYAAREQDEGRDLAISHLFAGFRERYHVSGEINSTVDDGPAAVDRLRERYADGNLFEIDGLSVEFEDWHFNVRPSNTEPLLRLNLESLVSEEDMERRRDEVLEVIRSG